MCRRDAVDAPAMHVFAEMVEPSDYIIPNEVMRPTAFTIQSV